MYWLFVSWSILLDSRLALFLAARHQGSDYAWDQVVQKFVRIDVEIEANLEVSTHLRLPKLLWHVEVIRTITTIVAITRRRYLVENGASVVAVNSEGEVPLDIAEEDEMVEYLQQEVDKQGNNEVKWSMWTVSSCNKQLPLNLFTVRPYSSDANLLESALELSIMPIRLLKGNGTFTSIYGN